MQLRRFVARVSCDWFELSQLQVLNFNLCVGLTPLLLLSSVLLAHRLPNIPIPKDLRQMFLGDLLAHIYPGKGITFGWHPEVKMTGRVGM